MGTPEQYRAIKEGVCSEATARARKLLRLVRDDTMRGVNAIAIHHTREADIIRVHRTWRDVPQNGGVRKPWLNDRWRATSIRSGCRYDLEWREFRLPKNIDPWNPYPWYVVAMLAARHRIRIVVTFDGLPITDLPKQPTGQDITEAVGCWLPLE